MIEPIRCARCNDKVIFRDQHTAESRAAELGMRAYFEEQCGWYHLTRQLHALAVPHATMPKLGAHDDISNADYHSGPGISKSGISAFLRSPAHYRTYKTDPSANKRTDAKDGGTAFHTMILEPELYAEKVAIKPNVGKRKNVDKEFWAEWERENHAKAWVTQAAHDNVERMADAVRAHSKAAVLCDPTLTRREWSYYWTDKETRKLCKARPDAINDGYGMCVDLKRARDARLSKFQRDVKEYQYHVQAAFYLDGLRACGEPLTRFLFVAVEPEPPYAISCVELEPDMVEHGRLLYRRGLNRYAQCLNENDWPGYPEDIRTLQAAPWFYKEEIS